ncbi:MAG: bifunctional 2',3'-cyclic-nucleotide 2'-phosphodiesterase/3'-nucleotidase [Proteobacteria bacterium]|nr:bifunctional 2',3'-cyclic-nucleotide 2'-phosphodiesterase/3'-nucleotidase [Pseudomonadota bacterium]
MVAASTLLLANLSACGDNYAVPKPNPTIELRILETTDIHVYISDYDYYRDSDSITVGLARTASLIRDARNEVPNSVLVDNGDLIQGNPLGDYMNERGLAPGDVHPVYKAMNLLDYDVGNIGNHEFNYGLDFLRETLGGAAFPHVSANVFYDDKDADDSNDVPYFNQYIIKDKQFVDTNGNRHAFKIGYIGFVPPQIMTWDRANLVDKVIAKDMVDVALDTVPLMETQGVDLIVAIPHSGLHTSAKDELEEDAAYYLAGVSGIDVITFGHSHRVFPGPDYQGLAGVDIEKGTVRGVPAVMAGFWGSHLGIVDLTLQLIDDEWTVIDSRSQARPIAERKDNQTVAIVDAETAIRDAIGAEHQATLQWINQPLGEISAPINSFFALVQDDPSIQIVTESQRLYVENLIQGGDLDGIPVLSAGAPFKAGYGSTENYTDIPKGVVSMRNMADLYLYPNTLQVVRINGRQVRNWLERSAGAFNQIDPNSDAEQPLLNPDFPSYNFDVIDGVDYDIDITQPSRYDSDGNLLNANVNRIKNLRYNDQPVTDEQIFLVATNNYRAGGAAAFPSSDPTRSSSRHQTRIGRSSPILLPVRILLIPLPTITGVSPPSTPL